MTILRDWTEGEPVLALTTCDDCGAAWYLPRDNCRVCESPEMTRSTSAGDGVCTAVTLLHTARPPFALVLVELDGGPLVMGRSEGEITPGDRVYLGFISLDDQPFVPCFARKA